MGNKAWGKGILLALLLASSLSACGREPVGPHVGQWRTSTGETWEFAEDGTVSVTKVPEPRTGTYELENANQVRLAFDGQEAVVASIEVSGDQMRIISDTLGILEFIRVRQPEGE